MDEMNALLLAVLLVLLLLFFKMNGNTPDKPTESFEYEPSVDMIEFRAKDPKQAKYTRHHDRDEWGLDSSEKYYENQVYYNNGMSELDPRGESVFEDPAGAPPVPRMSSIERLGYEVLGDQATPTDGRDPKFAPVRFEGSQEEPM